MKLVVIGDVGVLDGMIHIGDEAMFEQLVLQLRSRGADQLVGLSANPADTSERYGVESISPIGFTGTRDEMRSRLSAILAAASAGVPAPDAAAQAVIDAVLSSDGVAIAGGGNMMSNWPGHVFERSALGQLARIAGVPLVVSGQTIGPRLSDGDEQLVAELLSSARRVGLREPASFELTASLGVPTALLTQTIDDASFLHVTDVNTAAYCLVSLSGHVGEHDRGDMVRAIAALLDGVVAVTGLEVVFSPHFGALDAMVVRGDSVIHEAVRSAMTSPSSTLAAVDAATSARLARNAAFVVSSRYHPVVFAVSAGVPTIGIPVDDYTRVKLTGALGNFAQHGVLPAEELLAGDVPVADLWARRHDIGRSGRQAAEANRAASNAWWDAVFAEFS